MSTSFYHCAWKVYHHEIVEAAPDTAPSTVWDAVKRYISLDPSGSYLKKLCLPCKRSDRALKEAKRVLALSRCPHTCPNDCPNHTQLVLPFTDF